MKKMFVAALLFGAMGTSFASAETYVCKIKPQITDGWIPTTLAVDYDTQTGDVVVYDEYIMHFHGKPIAGKVAANNSKRITFAWTLNSVDAGGGARVNRFNFRASYLKANGKMVVTSQPSGYQNNFRGRGRCSIK